MSIENTKRDLSLFPGQYIFIQDGSKGVVKVMTGPAVVTPSGSDKPVIYDHKKGTFVQTNSLEEAVKKASVAVEGYYIELLNPAKDNNHPADGQTASGTDLVVGRKINIPGPAMFPLWPGQVATVIRGHHLRSNQYLLCRVYNDEEAKKNWGNAIMKKASALTAPAETATKEEKDSYARMLAEEKKNSVGTAPPDLTVGKMFIIRGTEVSFFIPPTGITVVPEGVDDVGNETYTREALTLERLEYAVLVDENGKKRFEVGPSVVFPTPTERFIETQGDDKHLTRKFRAVELNDIQGIHVKVIAPYEENGKKYAAGEELFITGKNTPIYYPREEHASVKYDGKTKHFATAVPAGEARYVMNRMTGEIKMAKGPQMLLPDPRTEIIVRRVLSDKQVSYWYPGNIEALTYNQNLRAISVNAPTTRQGVVSEGEIERSLQKSGRMAGVPQAKAGVLNSAYSTTQMAESSNVSREQKTVGDELTRTSGYNSPRTLTLEGKYQGVPAIELWTNYASLIVSKTGGRRVEVGPKTIQLEYDESLEVLEISTGRPKTTDHLLRTVFLRVENNKISDKILVETSDHVRVELYLSYVINFEGSSDKWFAVENYVKFLCDRLRSILKGSIRKSTIAEFYKTSTDVIRAILLNEKGEKDAKGSRFFPENSMRLADVEVLGVEIKDERIARLVSETQHETVKSNIDIANAQRKLDFTRVTENISRETTDLVAETQKLRNEVEKDTLMSQLSVTLSRLANQLREADEIKKLEASRQEIEKQKNDATLSIRQAQWTAEVAEAAARQAQKIELLKAEAEAIVTKFTAMEGNFTQALLSLSNNDTLVKVSEAINIQRVLGGDNIADTLAKAFPNGPLAPFVKTLTSSMIPTTGTQSGSSSKSSNA